MATLATGISRGFKYLNSWMCLILFLHFIHTTAKQGYQLIKAFKEINQLPFTDSAYVSILCSLGIQTALLFRSDIWNAPGGALAESHAIRAKPARSSLNLDTSNSSSSQCTIKGRGPHEFRIPINPSHHFVALISCRAAITPPYSGAHLQSHITRFHRCFYSSGVACL